ncbi:MAG: Uma2 family endonuclease [Deltaproteobacteria bacterium]|nr:Uma2 family endonuclease [Deltaproteobacteria bacterium]MCB9785465.1 Uma2 family endonuclease [Deltaproteobacteria bacterium]
MSSSLPASIPPGRLRLTVQDYLELPDDGRRYELLDGEIVTTPAAVPRHQRIVGRLYRALVSQLDGRAGGETLIAPIDVVLDTGTVVQPDVLWIARERLSIIGEKCIEGPPDLVVEVLSPSTRRRDVLTKSTLYARFGVRMYWIADPDLDRLERYRLEDDTYVHLGTEQAPNAVEPAELPGLRLDLAHVFG